MIIIAVYIYVCVCDIVGIQLLSLQTTQPSSPASLSALFDVINPSRFPRRRPAKSKRLIALCSHFPIWRSWPLVSLLASSLLSSVDAAADVASGLSVLDPVLVAGVDADAG